MPLIAVSAIVPSLLLLWFFHSRDVYPEPARVIWATFFLGVLTVAPVLGVDELVVRWLGHPLSPYADGFGQGFLVAAIPEEFFKFLVVVLYCSRHREFDEPMDGIVYGAVASLGFATLENILYVSEHGIAIAFVRAVSAVPGHAFMGALMGYFVGQAKFNPARRAALLIRAYVTAMILHGLYDAGLFTINAMTERAHHHELQGQASIVAGALLVLTLGVLVFECIWSLRLMQRLRSDQFALALANPALLGAVPIATPGTWSSQLASPGRDSMPVGELVMSQQWPSPLPQTPTPISAWVLAIGGAALASIGGLVTLGLGAALVMGTPATQELGPVLLGGVIIGLLPLGGGLGLFALGMRKMKSAPVPAPAGGWMPYATR